MIRVRVAQILAEAGMNMAQFCRRSNLPYERVRRLSLGDHMLDLELLEATCRALGKDLSVVLLLDPPVQGYYETQSERRLREELQARASYELLRLSRVNSEGELEFLRLHGVATFDDVVALTPPELVELTEGVLSLAEAEAMIAEAKGLLDQRAATWEGQGVR